MAVNVLITEKTIDLFRNKKGTYGYVGSALLWRRD